MNELRWEGERGHYEVWYLTLTEPLSGCGAWIRYTLLAPLVGEATCSIWFLAMDPDGIVLGRKATLPIASLRATRDPFSLSVGDCVLEDGGMRGGCEDAAWDLSWRGGGTGGASHVHPLLRRTHIAKTVLTIPQPDIRISGTLAIGGRELRVEGAHGGQAHLWGSKHAARWAWAHCNDFDGHPGDWLDGVSVFVPRLGREIGPNTPVVGRLLGSDFRSISPLRVLRNGSRFGLQGWRLQAAAGDRRLLATVDAPREKLVGVTYTDPDGERAYCYNSEVASMSLQIWDSDGAGGWKLTDTLRSRGRAHYEYAQREPVAGMTMHLP